MAILIIQQSVLISEWICVGREYFDPSTRSGHRKLSASQGTGDKLIYTSLDWGKTLYNTFNVSVFTDLGVVVRRWEENYKNGQ
jgi:hypothetical protein